MCSELGAVSTVWARESACGALGDGRVRVGQAPLWEGQAVRLQARSRVHIEAPGDPGVWGRLESKKHPPFRTRFAGGNVAVRFPLTNTMIGRQYARTCMVLFSTGFCVPNVPVTTKACSSTTMYNAMGTKQRRPHSQNDPLSASHLLLCFSQKLDPQHPLQHHEPPPEPMKQRLCNGC